ncbi:MAG: GspH/FimT family pseudopilin [Hyphomicrobiaceae bacterium]
MIARPSSCNAGFSMLELLVVLAILAAVMTVALPNFQSPGSRTNIDAITVEIAGQLKALRARAIASNRDQTFVLDAPAHAYTAGEAAAVTRLPKTVAITFESAREISRGPGDARLIFFSTGGSTGGRLSLSQDQSRRAVAVDWLTGTVSIERDPK